MVNLPPKRTKPPGGSLLDAVGSQSPEADARTPSLLDAAFRPKRTPRIDVEAYAPPPRRDAHAESPAETGPSRLRYREEPAAHSAAYGEQARPRRTLHDDAYEHDDHEDEARPSLIGRLAARLAPGSRADARDDDRQNEPDARVTRERNADRERRSAVTPPHAVQEVPHVASGAPLADKPLVDLRVVIGSVWKLRYAIVATTVLGAVAGVMLALATPNKYVATSKLYVDPREMRLTDSDLSKQSLATEGILALVDSQLEVLRSRGVLEKVVTDLGLERDPEFGAASGGLFSLFTTQPAAGSGGNAVATRSLDALAKAIAVGRDPKTFIITVDVTSRDPAKSALIANRLVDTFLAEEQSAQSAFYRRTTEALDSRLEELRKELDTAENAVEDFKANNDIVGANGQLISEKELSSLNDQVSATRSRIAEAKAKVDVASRVSPNAVIGGNFPEEVNSLTMTELRKQYATAKTELGALEANLGPRHPQRLAAAQSVETARNEIANELNRIAANARAELARAEQAERDLVNQLDTQKTRQITASSSYVQLRDLERTANATRAIYESFLKRARETSEEQKLSDRNIRVISKAEPPLQPVGPSRKLIAIAGVIGGLFLGLGLGVLFGIVTSLRPLFDPPATGRNLRRTGRRDRETSDRADRLPPRPQHRPAPSRKAYATADDDYRAADERDVYRAPRDHDDHWRQAPRQDARYAPAPSERYPDRTGERYAGYDDGPMPTPRGYGRPLATAGASQDAVEALLMARRMMEEERSRDEAPPASRAKPRSTQPIDHVEDDLRALRHRVEAYVRRQAGGRH